MQVAHVNASPTHAVISGGETIEFGISSSAEFFNILSSTLYKDQILAVVREVLCNAWDAHIAAGCTDKAVEVTLKDNVLVVRDFGLGIPHDQIGLVYGTYGNSTKKHDGKQTGGFGLGCKAPFAYVDHFEVTSTNQGTRTIYALSKSSAKAMGKPGITQIASFPNDDRGLCVSLKVKQEDAARFRTLIRLIAHNGDMKVTLNDNAVSTINFPKESSFLVTDNGFDHYINLLYGNVIYPVEEGSGIEEAYRRAKLALASLSNRGSRHLILRAPAHSIAVTPSREGLSMQEHTVKTLNNLLTHFADLVQAHYPISLRAVAAESISSAIKEGSTDAPFRSGTSLHSPKLTENGNGPLKSHDFDLIASRHIYVQPPEDAAFVNFTYKVRVNSLIEAKVLDAAWGSALLEGAEKSGSVTRMACWSTFFLASHAKTVATLMRTGARNKGLDYKNLSLVGVPRYYGKGGGWERTTIPILEVRPSTWWEAMTMARKVVAVGSATAGTVTRLAGYHKELRANGGVDGILFYRTGTKKGAQEAAVEFFTKHGYRVIDMSQRLQGEPEPKKREPTVKKPKAEGYMMLSNGIFNNYVSLSRAHMAGRHDFEPKAPRILAPEFFYYHPTNSDSSSVHGIGRPVGITFIKQFGHRGAYISDARQKTKAIAAGLPSHTEWLLGQLEAYFDQNPRCLDIAKYDAHNIAEEADVDDSVVKKMLACPALLAQQKLSVLSYSEEELRFISLLKDAAKRHYYDELTPQLTKLRSFIHRIEETAPDLALVCFFKKLRDSPFAAYIDFGVLSATINDPDPAERAKATEILNLLINHDTAKPKHKPATKLRRGANRRGRARHGQPQALQARRKLHRHRTG